MRPPRFALPAAAPFLVAALVLGTLAGCASEDATGSSAGASASPSGDAAGGVVGSDMVKPVGGDLREGDTWYLVGAVSDTSIPTTVTLTFDGDTASGSGPVNTYSTSFTATEDGGLELGPIASTRMAGPDDAMAAETAYFALLEEVDGYTAVEGGELYLFDGDLQVLTYSEVPVPTDDLTVPAEVTDLAGSVVGMTEAEAQSAVEKAGYTFRVLMRDGEGLPATADYRVDRINVEIEDGTVTSASVG